MESNLVHLEEYVDTIISLPHEIQRNLTMIREHDAKVQEKEKNLFVDVNDFMGLQSGVKSEISEDKRIELIQRIKNSFLSTLTHCEEKVSLADQCYNLVEKHLIKMEEDLKCFEEEIRLSGYSDLLEKVQLERRKQREQVRNKQRQEASLTNEEESEEEAEEAERDESSSEKEQQQSQQQQQQKKRKTSANRSASNPNPKKQARETGSSKKTTFESDDEAQMTKISRAERLLRRNKPNYVDGKESEERKEDLIENQGDDEAEEADESDRSEVESETESEIKEDPLAEEPAIQNLLTINSSRNNSSSSSGASSGEDSQTAASLKSSKPRPQYKPSERETYCTCNRGSFGEMIGCDAKDCPVEWFHYECVGLKSPPKGKWYCKGCQEAMDAKTAAQLSIGISTRSSRRS